MLQLHGQKVGEKSNGLQVRMPPPWRERRRVHAWVSEGIAAASEHLAVLELVGSLVRLLLRSLEKPTHVHAFFLAKEEAFELVGRYFFP